MNYDPRVQRAKELGLPTNNQEALGNENQASITPSSESPRPAQADGPKVHDVTVRVCQPCIDLQGQECHTPACVFCFHGMEEVKWLLDKMLICPIIDGERIVLAGDNVPTELPIYLECVMCGASEAFVISKQDPSTGYCFAEKREWVIRSKRNHFPCLVCGTEYLSADSECANGCARCPECGNTPESGACFHCKMD